MKFSIIVPAHNEEKFIEACLQSIQKAAQTSGNTVEIVVVLNRCTDMTEKISLRYGACISREEEKNIAKIRNAGVKASTGDVILTLDSDSRMHPNTFSEIKNLLGSGKYIGGGARIKPERYSLGIIMSLLSVAPYVLAGGVSGGLFWCYRKDFDAIGGFNESLLSLEDMDFGKRLKALGKKRNLSYGTLKQAIITSCRKFDMFGDWYLFLNPWLVKQLFKGTDTKATDLYYYNVKR
jgi:glycosyltransferase involved in cell wall biosynthesis